MSGRLPAELAVGFEEIDGQHRLLLRDLEVARAAVDHGDVEAVKTALASVGDAFVAHFAAEESFMAESSYPDRGKHKGAHDMFLQDLGQLGRELETFGLAPLVRHWITNRLPEWTRFHIQVNDAPLGRFLATRRFRPRGVSKGDEPHVS